MLLALKAATPKELVRLLNGAILSRTNLVRGRDVRPNPAAPPHDLYKHPVAGMTLLFSEPVGSVTFSDDLDFKEIVAEINTAMGAEVAHLLKSEGDVGMVLALWNDAAPVDLSDMGTANIYFGFSSANGSIQNVIEPDMIYRIAADPLSRMYVCFVDWSTSDSDYRITEANERRRTEDNNLRVLE